MKKLKNCIFLSLENFNFYRPDVDFRHLDINFRHPDINFAIFFKLFSTKKFSKSSTFKAMKIKTFFILTSITSIFTQHNYSNFDNGFRLTGMQCKSYDKTHFEYDFCFIKKISLAKSSINLALNLKRPLEKPLNLQIILSRKTQGNFFQTYLKTELVEFCGVLEGAKAHSYMKLIFESIRNTAPMIMKGCPFEKYINASNIVYDGTKSFHIMVPGVYKTEFFFMSIMGRSH